MKRPDIYGVRIFLLNLYKNSQECYKFVWQN